MLCGSCLSHSTNRDEPDLSRLARLMQIKDHHPRLAIGADESRLSRLARLMLVKKWHGHFLSGKDESELSHADRV